MRRTLISAAFIELIVEKCFRCLDDAKGTRVNNMLEYLNSNFAISTGSR